MRRNQANNIKFLRNCTTDATALSLASPLRRWPDLLSVLGLGLIYFLAAQSLPDYDKEIALPGLLAPVEIVRDNANVPHIFGSYGASDEDVYFGLGYAHAQDRLWQMTVLRRTAKGRLSEIFGSRTVPVDTLVRRLDIYRLAQQSVSAQTPEAMTALQAYSAGVNARLQEINDDALGRGAPEMFLFNVPMAPWQPGVQHCTDEAHGTEAVRPYAGRDPARPRLARPS